MTSTVLPTAPKREDIGVTKTDDAADGFAYKYSSDIELPSASDARIVAAAVSTDGELRPEQVERTITTDGTKLQIRVRARDARSLRTSVVSLYDFVRVSVEALSIVPRV